MTFIILNIHVIFLNYKCINDHLWPISADFHYLYTDNPSDTITICNFILNTHTLHIYIHIYIHITIYLYIYLLKFFNEHDFIWFKCAGKTTWICFFKWLLWYVKVVEYICYKEKDSWANWMFLSRRSTIYKFRPYLTLKVYLLKINLFQFWKHLFEIWYWIKEIKHLF